MEAELLAEERVAPRLVRQRPAVVQRLSRCLNRVDDAAVAGAPADMSVERLLDRLAIARLPLLDQVRGADDDARDAETALNAAFEDEGVADDSPRSFRERLQCRDVVSRHLLRLAQAGERRFAVDVDQAAPARAFGRAAVLTGRDAALFPQHLEEVHARFVVGFDVFTVEVEIYARHPEGLSAGKVLKI